jgi:hypothetical protein
MIQAGRRDFFSAIGVGGIGLALAKTAGALTTGPLNASQRREVALQIRQEQAIANRNSAPLTDQETNGDEESLVNKIGSYTKGLRHNAEGEVDLAAYETLIVALNSGDPRDFERIAQGGTRKQTNPQGGLAYDMQGGDGASFRIAPPPPFSSRAQAADIAENYWMSLLRDVPFSEYASSDVAQAAAADLSLFGADAKVPKNALGQVTPELLFRGLTPGDHVGPYVSQFFYQPCPFGQNDVRQLVRSPLPRVDYLTDFASFLGAQNGQASGPMAFESTLRYMRDGRALSEWVHVDVLFQAYFMAYLVLEGLRAPLDPGNPYADSRTQIGFATFGGPHVASLLCEVSSRALHATWYQKWFAHRRLRPEAFAGAAHVRLHRNGVPERFPVHDEILTSLSSSTRIGGYLSAGNALLPVAFPEGSPTHPSYTAGHATVAGACVTILKAFFDESFAIPRPMEPTPDGLALAAYDGELTVGGELNKVASNVAYGRNIAGMHWRTDANESLLLGERVAIQLMQEHSATFNESWGGISLTKFDGTRITI